MRLLLAFQSDFQGTKRASFNTYVDPVFIITGFSFIIWIISFFPTSSRLFFYVTLFMYFMMVQHYDRRGQYDVALTKINEAIEHTPTVIDLYSVKVCLCLC